MYEKLHNYIEAFNKGDEECYQQLIPNSEAEAFLAAQVPLVDLPDKNLEEIYYFRWWTFRKHIKQTDCGCIITEFLPDVRWSGPYNSINCPACFHIREGRWLKDPENRIRQYMDFWLTGKGDAHRYSAWYAHALLEYCRLKDDLDYAVQMLPRLVAYFAHRAETNGHSSGIYWSNDGLDGMEHSISGSGLRPTINAYAYADAVAIAEIAGLAGQTALQERFTQTAQQIKSATDRLLWDGSFYKTIPHPKDVPACYSQRPPVAPQHDVKELIGYTPWYFNLPGEGKDAAFSHLLRSDGFRAKYGLTTAEQSHPRFMEAHPHECLWNGPVWPFATSQVLVATANLLRNYHQNTITKDDYYRMLLQYATSHRITRQDGSSAPWIDENLHPYTGRWIARDILQGWGWLPDKGGYERGKDYNHSLFCDLILSGLLGIDVQDGRFTAAPLIPDSWKYFRVDNLWLHGHRYQILYDKDGSHYTMGSGLQILEY